jgi:hypothetical protein
VIFALIGLAALLICLTFVGLVYHERNGTSIVRRCVVVCNLDNGHAIRGVLDSVHADVLVLSAASVLGQEITDMAGRVLVPRHRVLWVQEPGQALAAPGDAA